MIEVKEDEVYVNGVLFATVYEVSAFKAKEDYKYTYDIHAFPAECYSIYKSKKEAIDCLVKNLKVYF